jgi:hypothetical protein
MVIKSNAVHSGWNFDQEGINSDNISLGSTYSTNRKENQTKIEEDKTKKYFTNKSTRINNNNKHTDEVGWTTTTPGNRKPKNKITKASTESIIMTIEGNIDKIEAGTNNKIWRVPDGTASVVVRIEQTRTDGGK